MNTRTFRTAPIAALVVLAVSFGYPTQLLAESATGPAAPSEVAEANAETDCQALPAEDSAACATEQASPATPNGFDFDAVDSTVAPAGALEVCLAGCGVAGAACILACPASGPLAPICIAGCIVIVAGCENSCYDRLGDGRPKPGCM